MKSHARTIVIAIPAATLLAATLLAATVEPRMDELDEVIITAGKELTPLQDFVEFPKYESVAISPDGTRIALVWTPSRNYKLSILAFPSLNAIEDHALPATQSLADVSWANDHRLLLQQYWQPKGFLRRREPVGVIMISDANGDNRQNFINGGALLLDDPLGKLREEEAALVTITRDGIPEGGKWPGKDADGSVRLLGLPSGQTDRIYFQTTRSYNEKGSSEGFGAFLLQLKDLHQTRVATLPIAGGTFITGPEHRIALATGVNTQNQQVVYYLPEKVRANGRDWQLVASAATGERGLRPVAWTGKGEEYYAFDSTGPTQSVVIWNAATHTQQLLYRHVSADMNQFALDPAGKVWMFQGSDHFPVYWYPDPDHPLSRVHRLLLQKAPNELVEIVSASDDLAFAVARASSGRRPPVYMVIDSKSGNSIVGMFTYPSLRNRPLAQVDSFEFQARDGLKIRGYLTAPRDEKGQPRKGLPLLVIAHDGPLGEPATPAFEYERQLFASRGYAVLQVNRRGSPGRGMAFERAGDGKWGQETQDDFVDAVHAIIKAGAADPERVCFYGSGYGAYTAMVAAAREPDMFKCVIGVSGVYDVAQLLGDGKSTIPADLAQVLGQNLEELRARSPVNLVGSIKASVLLMPQRQDKNFPASQSEKMYRALRKAGKEAKSQMIGNEYEGQHSPATRAKAYVQILDFLGAHIGR